MHFYRRVVLPWLLEKGMSRPEIRAQRRQSLAPAAGRVLEIGFGFGGTLGEYPKAPGRIEIVIGLEPNPGMIRRAAPGVARAAFPVRVVRASAAAIPFRDASFDTVASNFTLCSLPDPDVCLREIRRVLRPGGRFVFLEHGLAEDARVRRRQKILAPLFRILGDGCRPDRAIDAIVAAAGLAIETLARYEGPIGPRTARQIYRGAARRLDSPQGLA